LVIHWQLQAGKTGRQALGFLLQFVDRGDHAEIPDPLWKPLRSHGIKNQIGPGERLALSGNRC
jgi:hypothetical protein